jgi:hypothetical protein
MSHGLRQDTVNQFAHATSSIKHFMITLIAVEIAGWVVLVAGFIDGQFVH